MKHTHNQANKILLLGLVLLLSVVLGGTAGAATYDLCAGEAAMAMPDGQAVTVWGLALDTGGACAPTLPGPVLRVDWNDPDLTVNLRNTLTEPMSLHILGQQLTNNAGPVWDGGVAGARPNLTARVRSFTHEAAAGGTAMYTWAGLKPGTYLLMSGTNPAKQVQMGLSAPVVKDAALGVAYADNPDVAGDQSVPYDQELILVFQEIDPEIHAAVAAGTYGPGGTITSSVYREPRYFLINGMGFPDAGLDPVNAALPVNVDENLLIRFINAGAETDVPQLLGDYLNIVAEDGNALKYPRTAYSFELDSAKTMDAVYTPAAPGRLPILDARLNLTNNGVSPGGSLAYLQVGGTQAGGDTVTIQNVVYDADNGTLMLIANSSTQPSVMLTAEGYGPLGWKSWLNFYRTTFNGVAAQPTSILVTSTGGGSAIYTFPPPDTVSIQSVTYDPGAQSLVVIATSSAQPDASLTAEGYGALGWKSWLNFYRTTFTGVASQPANVTVTSSSGGTDTWTP